MTEHRIPYDDGFDDPGWNWEDGATMAQEMEQGRKSLRATLRCKFQGYAFDLEAELTADQIPMLIGKLRSVGVEPGNSPYLWDGQGPAPKAAQSAPVAPPQAPAYPHGNQPAQVAHGTLSNGVPPVCPRHNSTMKESKFGGWYCTAKTDNPEWANANGYCNYTEGK